jgi:hypothetical protein
MISGAQLETIIDATASKALFDANFTGLPFDIAKQCQWEMWDVSLAARELALQIHRLQTKIAAIRDEEDETRGDINAEHRLSARQLGIEGALV